VEWQTALPPFVFAVVNARAVAYPAVDVVIEVVPGSGTHLRREQAGAIGPLEPELVGCVVVRHAVVKEDGVYAESGVNLRHLGRLAVGKRRIADFHHVSEPARDSVAVKQVADQ